MHSNNTDSSISGALCDIEVYMRASRCKKTMLSINGLITELHLYTVYCCFYILFLAGSIGLRTLILQPHVTSHCPMHTTLTVLCLGGRGARNVPKTPAVENDRILQILLNLIETLADDSLNPTRTQLNTVGAASAGSLGIAAITRFLVKSGSAKSTGLCSATTANSTTSTTSTTNTATTATTTSTSAGLSTEPGWLPPLQVPEIVTRQNSASDGAGGGACKGCGDGKCVYHSLLWYFTVSHAHI